MTEESAWDVHVWPAHTFTISMLPQTLRISCRVLKLSDCNALTYIFLKSSQLDKIYTVQ